MQHALLHEALPHVALEPVPRLLEHPAAACVAGHDERLQADERERLDRVRRRQLHGLGGEATSPEGLAEPVADLGGVALDSIPSFDTLVPVSLAIDLHESPALATAPDGPALLRRGALLSAALLAGIAKATTDQSVCYGIDREQFGQPVGGFQAVKHRCADMATRAEVATCQVLYAALAERDGRPDAEFHVHAARVVAARAAVENSQINVQNHGGIGFTWEHTAHRYVTRSRVYASVLGTTHTHLGATLAATAPQ